VLDNKAGVISGDDVAVFVGEKTLGVLAAVGALVGLELWPSEAFAITLNVYTLELLSPLNVAVVPLTVWVPDEHGA